MDNEARAGYGHMAIQNGSPDYGDNEFSEDATDTVANILHAIHEQGADPAQVLRCAVMHFEAEAGEGAAVNFAPPAERVRDRGHGRPVEGFVVQERRRRVGRRAQAPLHTRIHHHRRDRDQ